MENLRGVSCFEDVQNFACQKNAAVFSSGQLVKNAPRNQLVDIQRRRAERDIEDRLGQADGEIGDVKQLVDQLQHGSR